MMMLISIIIKTHCKEFIKLEIVKIHPNVIRPNSPRPKNDILLRLINHIIGFNFTFIIVYMSLLKFEITRKLYLYNYLFFLFSRATRDEFLYSADGRYYTYWQSHYVRLLHNISIKPPALHHIYYKACSYFLLNADSSCFQTSVQRY